MEKKKIKTQMKKGIIEVCILAVLNQMEGYPNDILAVFKKYDFDIPEGTLYPILSRLKDAGYLSYKWVESTEGPPRKYFALTKEGKEHYELVLESWLEIQQSMKSIIKNHS